MDGGSVALTVLLVIAGAFDVKQRRVPNWLNGLLLVCGMSIGLMHHRSLGDMCLTIGIAFAVILPFFHYRIYRGGDAKLLIACGAWLGLLDWLVGFALGMLLGAIYALGILLTSQTERGASLQSLRLLFWSRLGTLGEDAVASRPTVPMAVTFGAAMLCVNFVDVLEIIER